MISPFKVGSKDLFRSGLLVTGAAIVSVAVGCGGGEPEPLPGHGEKTRPTPPPGDPPARPSSRACTGPIRDLVTQVRESQGLGEESLAVSLSLEGRATETSGKISEPFARSTIKVVILALLLKERGGLDGLSPAEQDLARRMITDSDNDATAELYSLFVTRYGSSAGAAAAMTDLLRESGDSETTVPASIPPGLPESFISNYGATDWLPSNQVRFIQALWAGKLVDTKSSSYIFDLMGQVTPLGGGSWGLGTVSTGDRPSFKPGWGDTPSGQYLARQIGTVGGGGLPRASVALAAIAPSQEQAYAAVTELAQGVVEALDGPCQQG